MSNILVHKFKFTSGEPSDFANEQAFIDAEGPFEILSTEYFNDLPELVEKK